MVYRRWWSISLDYSNCYRVKFREIAAQINSGGRVDPASPHPASPCSVSSANPPSARLWPFSEFPSRFNGLAEAGSKRQVLVLQRFSSANGQSRAQSVRL